MDDSIPTDTESYLKLANEIVSGYLRKGKNVVVHCMGGLGRAPTFAATCLIVAGVDPDLAIELVKKCRKGSLKLQSQQNFLRKLK